MMLLILWIVAIVVGTAVGAARGHGVAGFFLSLFLSWFGVAITLLLPRKSPPANITNIHNEINNGE
jgi:hypothetical protein